MAKGKSEWFEWTKALVVALLLAVVIRYFLFAPIIVEGQSMMPTLQDQDRLIVNKIGYRISDPSRFDVVVFHATADKDYIKRVIGLPGDSIAYEDDILYINGEPVEEPYLDALKADLDGEGLLTQNFTLEEVTGEEVVPEGHVFVLGDNRRHSKDSRNIGTIPYDEVVGKANLVFWPMSEIRIAR
ncbi:signal peptidase I [Desertibacillus haloalkaliphilus]|uniref:signal peptidase I n=1 Tax=Desertibacillus haloalkaliphilus TaxID=1328930 RepID=UPI001C27B6DB|nr:signal peptidase I [Desertibacillus haloalkaliphilus]MBU8907033.1 signal peptidase I [Desertibacillus haloalkaliphilus]